MSLGRVFKLNTGATIPALGFGTFANHGAKGESYTSVLTALRVGYRHLDCAWFYQNEDEIGDAIRDFINESDGKVKREDLFITTKVWNHLHEPDEVAWSLDDSLRNLKLDYVDLFLIHWPIASERTADYQPAIGINGKYITKPSLTADPTPTWRAMEAQLSAGKTRAIGVSNWTAEGLKKLFGICKVPPAVNQVEIHPFLPNTELLSVAKYYGVLLVAYSPLGSQHQVPTTGEKVTENPELIRVAQRCGKSVAQTLIAWGIMRGYPVLPKSSNANRIKANFDDFEISYADFETINQIAYGRKTRFINMKDTFGFDLWPEES